MAGVIGRVFLVLAVAAGLLSSPATALSGAQADELILRGSSPLSDDGRLQELVFNTPAVPGTELKVRILLPAGYDHPANASVRYPMLLLLHGASGDSSDWTTKTDLVAHEPASDLIVVMPDGGEAGFYTDWIDGPQWETFHIDQLIGWVDANYRTVGAREGRAIAGLSMGGFGAMVYATRHPDLFVAAASFSGAVDIADGELPEALALELLGLADDRKWGPYETDEVTWRDHNPPDLATNLPPMSVAFWTGNGVPNPTNGDRVVPPADPIESGVWTMNTMAHTRFMNQDVPHEYHNYGPGTHEWHYWERDLHEWLPTLHGVLADPPAAPDAFTYRSAEPEFDVWGWSFAAERDVKEFVYLSGVSRAGLAVRGSGVLHVSTPSLFEPGRSYSVTALPGGGSGTFEVAAAGGRGEVERADQNGRLGFTVDLGPSHSEQQYTLAGDLAALQPDYWTSRTVIIEPTRTLPARPEQPATTPRTPGPQVVSSVASPPNRPQLPATGRDAALPIGLALAATGLVLLRRGVTARGGWH